MPHSVTKAFKRAGQLMPKPVRRQIKTSGKRLIQQLPTPVKEAIARFYKLDTSTNPKKTKQPSQPKYPLDHLGLAAGVANRLGKGSAKNTTGRAAAGTVLDGQAAERLHRAMFGQPAIARTAAGGRIVSGVIAPDLRKALCLAGHAVRPFVPGISSARANQADVIVIDIDGFNGVWDGALDPSGIGLMREVYDALETARSRGVTCWLVMRGDLLHQHGAILLQGSNLVEVLIPGSPRLEQSHFTENPGDVPAGIVDIIRNLEAAA